MARQGTRSRAQPRRLPPSTNSFRIPFPDALHWDHETRWNVTNDFIRTTISQLGLPEVDPNVPLNLYVLPDRLPGGFNKPNYFLLSLLAIAGSPEKKLKLSEIYAAIDGRYPELEEKRPAYKRSLRHKLSLEPIFVNLKESADERRPSVRARENPESRGNYWAVDIRRIHIAKRGRKGKGRNAGGSPSSSSVSIPLLPPYTTSNAVSHAYTTTQNTYTASGSASFQEDVLSYSNNRNPNDDYGYASHPAQMLLSASHEQLRPLFYSEMSSPLPNAVDGGDIVPQSPFHITIHNTYENCTFFQ